MKIINYWLSRFVFTAYIAMVMANPNQILKQAVIADKQQNYSQAISAYQQASQQGNVQAQLNLGVLYFYGRGVAQNFELAKFYWLQAAEQGHVQAKFYLGLLFAKQFHNLEQAIIWWKQAGQQKHALAMVNLAQLYLSEGNYSEARTWLQKAVDLNNALAQYHLAWSYLYEPHRYPNYDLAIPLLQQAVLQQQADAQYELGRLYYYGLGLDLDKVQARKLWLKAAKQNQTQAQYALAKEYYYQTNYEQAKYWWQSAVKLAPDHHNLSALSWLLATCSSDTIRNGNDALVFAKQLLALPDTVAFDVKARHFVVIASAYAELGEFKQAIIMINKAIAIVAQIGHNKWQHRLLKMKQAYNKGQAWRVIP